MNGSKYTVDTIESIFISLKDVEELRECGAVGDINSRFFDENGEEVSCKINQHVLGLNLNDLKKIPLIMTIAITNDKLEPLQVALKQKLVNIFVTSDRLAEELLKD